MKKIFALFITVLGLSVLSACGLNEQQQILQDRIDAYAESNNYTVDFDQFENVSDQVMNVTIRYFGNHANIQVFWQWDERTEENDMYIIDEGGHYTVMTNFEGERDVLRNVDKDNFTGSINDLRLLQVIEPNNFNPRWFSYNDGQYVLRSRSVEDFFEEAFMGRIDLDEISNASFVLTLLEDGMTMTLTFDEGDYEFEMVMTIHAFDETVFEIPDKDEYEDEE